MMHDINEPEPLPEEGQMDVATRLNFDHLAFTKMIAGRIEKGERTYSTRLRSWNNRTARKDKIQEILDFCLYQEQELMEAYDIIEDLLLIVFSDEMPTGGNDVIVLAQKKIDEREIDSEAI